MPYFPTNPEGVRALLALPGSVTYVLGNRAPEGGLMYISSVGIASDVATVGVSQWSGALPVVGTKITIAGTSQSGGIFNVQNATVLSVTLNAAGVGTLTFALTNANVATAADGGTVSFVPQTTGETIANGSTIPFSPAFNQGRSLNNGFYEIVADSVAALPTAATFTPQHAIVNEDAAFFAIPGASIATIAGGAITSQGGAFATDAPFVRFAITGVSGTGSAALGVTF